MADDSPEVPKSYNVLVDWWREATGQTSEWHLDMTWRQAVLRRILLWTPVAVVAALALTAAGFYFFTGWRARDLASKAQRSLDEGQVRLALIQAESARALRPRHPRVLRAYASALAAAGDGRAMEVWEQIARRGPLSADDEADRAAAAVRLGDDTHFARGLEALEATGRGAEAEAWRARRALQRKDFTGAEQHFRRALTLDAPAEVRFEWARYLVSIATPEALAEAVGLVEAMASEPDGDRALAFGLTSVPAGPATRRAWAERVWRDRQPGREALLPAATVLVDDRHRSLDEVVEQLSLVYTGAPAEQRGSYAQWLLERKRPAEALDFARTSDARTSRGAFLVRAQALSETGDWAQLLRLVDSGSPVNEVVTLLLRARAERGLGRTAASERSWRNAIRAAVQRVSLPETLGEVDREGQAELADRVLLELCGEYASADYALRVARWRFSTRGEPRLRDLAYRRARQASPGAATVRDLGRLETLMNREPVDPAETAAALEAEPSNLDFRLTHALALLNDGRAAEARKVLEPCEAIRHQLQPAQKAVVAAVLAATGSQGEAVALARTMRSTQLTDAEYRLVYEFALAEPQTIAAPLATD